MRANLAGWEIWVTILSNVILDRSIWMIFQPSPRCQPIKLVFLTAYLGGINGWTISTARSKLPRDRQPKGLCVSPCYAIKSHSSQL